MKSPQNTVIGSLPFSVPLTGLPLLKAASSLLAKGSVSLEMEKVLSQIPGNEGVKAEKILALNPEHPVFKKLQNSENTETFNDLLDVLYTEALILEGFQIENPVDFIKKLNNLIK